MTYADETAMILEQTLDRLRRLYLEKGLSCSLIRKIGLKPQWNTVIGSGDACGMAINFTGVHNVQPSAPPEPQDLKAYVGRSLMDFAEAHYRSENIHLRSVAVAAMSALSQPFLGSASLQERGFEVLNGFAPWDRLIKPTDSVTVVGYGGLLRFLAGKCRELRVTEMRPRETFVTMIIGESIEYGPRILSIHGEEENESILKNSDVVIITASSLVNGTFAELLAYSGSAREVALYGPSASLIPDVLFERGVDYVLSHRIKDPVQFEYDMVNEFDMETALKAHQHFQVIFKEPMPQP
jgi:uncharacterized protein (DUF4213/DUF364 family)